MAGVKLLDLEHMREYMGDNVELFRELSESFLTRGPESFSTIKIAIKNGDFVRLQRAAHSLKSAIAIFGAFAAVAKAEALEQQAHSESTEDVDLKVVELEALVHQLEQEITTTFLSQGV